MAHEIKDINDLKSKLGIDALDTNTLKIDKPFSLTDDELNRHKEELARMGNLAKAQKLAEIIKEKGGITQATKDAKGDLRETLETGDVEKIKEFLTTGDLNPETLKVFIENINEVSGEKKTLLIGLIFTLLNKQGVSISKLTDKIELKAGKTTSGIKVATPDEVVSYQDIINNFGITTGKASVAEIQKALLYKTSGLDTYLQGTDKYSTNEYANRLITKYKDILDKRGFKFTTLGDTIDEENYKAAKKAIEEGITDNQSDREFLSVYFDDLFYSKSKMSNSFVNDFNKNKAENKDGLDALNVLGKFDDKTKYALGIGNSDVLAEKGAEFQNDFGGALEKSLNRGGAHLGALLGLLWGIYGGAKGSGFSFSRLIAGFMGGVGLGAVGMDGLGAIAKKGVDLGGEGVDKLGKPAYEWAKGKLSSLGNFSQEVYEKAEFWYDFSAVQINDGTGTKDLMDSKFVFLHDKANTEIGLFKKEGKELPDEEKTKLKEKLNEYFKKLQEKYPDKTPAQIKTEFKDKTLSEITVEVYKNEPKAEEKPASGNTKPTQNSNTPTGKLDFSPL